MLLFLLCSGIYNADAGAGGGGGLELGMGGGGSGSGGGAGAGAGAEATGEVQALRQKLAEMEEEEIMLDGVINSLSE